MRNRLADLVEKRARLVAEDIVKSSIPKPAFGRRFYRARIKSQVAELFASDIGAALRVFAEARLVAEMSNDFFSQALKELSP